jgi:hypothetical protein
MYYPMGIYVYCIDCEYIDYNKSDCRIISECFKFSYFIIV